MSEGRGLSLEEAVSYALRGRGSRSRAVSGWDSLTPSDRRVAFLAGERLSFSQEELEWRVGAIAVGVLGGTWLHRPCNLHTHGQLVGLHPRR